MLAAQTGAPYKPDPQSPSTATRDLFGIVSAAASAISHGCGFNPLNQVKRLLAQPITSFSSNFASSPPVAVGAVLLAAAARFASTLCKNEANPSSGAASTPGTSSASSMAFMAFCNSSIATAAS